MNLNKEENKVLTHSLGWGILKWHEKFKLDEKPYRNYFYTNEKSTDYPIIESLIEKGLMKDSGKGWGKKDKNRYFFVTDKGIDYIRKELKKTIRRPARSKARYELYRFLETNESFFEWLTNPYWEDYRKRNGVQ